MCLMRLKTYNLLTWALLVKESNEVVHRIHFKVEMTIVVLHFQYWFPLFTKFFQTSVAPYWWLVAQLLIEPLSMAFVQSCGKESCSPLQALTPSEWACLFPVSPGHFGWVYLLHVWWWARQLIQTNEQVLTILRPPLPLLCGHWARQLMLEKGIFSRLLEDLKHTPQMTRASKECCPLTWHNSLCWAESARWKALICKKLPV